MGTDNERAGSRHVNRADSLPQHCVEFLRKHDLLKPGSSYLVAASGGLDSTVLLQVLARLSAAWNLRVDAVYIHHGLREEADAEEHFVRSAAGALGCGFHTKTIDVRGYLDNNGGSMQAVARLLRYTALEEVRAEIDADCILTAHHADDQVETILMHFLRGSGVHGLSGIRAVTGKVIRPLLDVPRSELEAFAAANGIVWLHDISNDSDAYLRNIIRHHVIPVIHRYVNPDLRPTLTRTGALFASLESFLVGWENDAFHRVVTISGDGICLAVQGLKEYFEFQQFSLIRAAIRLCRDVPATYEETVAVQRLLERRTGSRVSLRNGVSAVRERDALCLSKPATDAPRAVSFSPGDTVRVGSAECSSMVIPASDVCLDAGRFIEYVDVALLREPCLIRRWNDGDWLIPLGFQHKKKVSDLLTDSKINNLQRQSTLVLECGNRIVWVCGVRLDERFKITESTEYALRLQYRVMPSAR